MKLPHVALAVLVAGMWGLAFVATRMALDDFSPPQLAAARFLVACAPALLLPRPRIPWALLIATGLTLFAAQFLLQFFGIALGMPPGLASVVMHTQAFYTIAFAALVLREWPTGRQLAGAVVAAGGVVAIGLTVGQDLTVIGLVLTSLSAMSWGVGNILLKRLPPVPILNLVVWLSLVPPLPALAVALALDGPLAIGDAIAGASWRGVASVLYLGVIGNIVAYAIWGALLRQYPAATVTPFALLVPFVASYASSIAFDERFGALRLGGMALVLLGLAIIVVPLGRVARGVPAASRSPS
ncbi:MAG: EamA family transporter [Candidatus Rokubacteria bacterium]|nr:EamA family transporter [Candidatus Rokubacteria bacterium]